MLKDHLQAVIGVEFFTIPFYLTAIYSFTDKALAYSTTSKGKKVYPLSDLQQKTLSVAVQEMYHLQGASNLANAFDVPPTITPEQRVFPAGKRITVPHLEPKHKPLTSKLGNLPAVIEAMIAVEKAAPAGKKRPRPRASVTYPSIGDLYHATLVLLEEYVKAHGHAPRSHDPHFIPDHNQVAYPTFQTRYRHNTIDYRSDILGVVNAIADQGEGREVIPDSSRLFRSGATTDAPCLVDAEFQPTAGSRFFQYDDATHFCRFEEIEKAMGGKKGLAKWAKTIQGEVFYKPDRKRKDLPDWAPSLKDLRHATTTIWSYLTDIMQEGLRKGSLSPNSGAGVGFDSAMIAFKYILPMTWKYGVCPSFRYRPGVSEPEAQHAMDTVDPYCLFHWDAATALVRVNHPDQKNACQGLNSCKGLGWGGLGNKPGDGACATADFHTCQGGNHCNHQGGCGFLSTDPKDTSSFLDCSEQWIPGANHGAGTGGCQTPIGTKQVFDRTYKESPDKIPPKLATCDKIRAQSGTSVWEQARELFQKKHGNVKPQKPKKVGAINYDGMKRRGLVPPTSR